MKTWLILALLWPLLAPAQRRSESGIQQSVREASRALGRPDLSPRPPGSPEASRTAAYLEAAFRRQGLLPAGASGSYLEPLSRNLGLEPLSDGALSLGGIPLQQGRDYQVLPFSGRAKAQGDPLISVPEPGNIWILNLQDALDPDQTYSPAQLLAFMYRYTRKADSSGAKALLFYDSGSPIEHFDNPEPPLPPLSLPAAFLNPAVAARLLKDPSASIRVSLNLGLQPRILRDQNVLGLDSASAGPCWTLAFCYQATAELDRELEANLLALPEAWKGQRHRSGSFVLLAYADSSRPSLGLSRYLEDHPAGPSRPLILLSSDAALQGAAVQAYLSPQDKAVGRALERWDSRHFRVRQEWVSGQPAGLLELRLGPGALESGQGSAAVALAELLRLLEEEAR